MSMIEVARRMGAGATSIMLIEGDELRLRASVGLPTDVRLGRGQRVGEGIAGWVAASGEKVVLRGRVTDERFHGVDPEARESISVPLRVGDDVLGVLSVKRPKEADGFSGRQTLLEGIAADLSRALQAMNVIAALQRDREHAEGMAEVALAVAAGDAHGAARAAAESFGHHAVALRGASGKVLAVYAQDDDPECRTAALSASESGGSTDVAGTTGVGFARHDPAYDPEEEAIAQRTADTLALLGHAEVKREHRAVLRVLAVEDHPVMQLGVRALLEREGLMVVGLTSTCSEAIGLLEDAQPDVVLCDLHLPDADGAEAIVRLRAEAPALPLVAFSIDRSPELIRAVLRAGGNGYVSKDTPASRVIAALHAAVEGLVALGREAAASIAKAEIEPRAEVHTEPTEIEAARLGTPPVPNGVAPNGSSETTAASHDALTPRELELLRYMAEGYTNKEIARAMVLAEDTVKKGVQMLIAKLGAADRTHAVVLALRNHLID